jgi:glycosyltransferase involved in cell wall biosynthesis
VAFPPFRVVTKNTGDAPSVNASTGVAAVAAFDAVAFAEKFWRDQLAPAATRAPGAPILLADLRRDPAAAAKTHAHRVGLGNAAFYFVRGTGRVTAVERSRLLIEIDGFVVAPGDAAALVDRLRRLRREPELLAAMSRAALVRATEFGPGRHLDELMLHA